MKNYIKPSAEVVELAVKEPISLKQKTDTKSFGFGSNKSISKTISLITYSNTEGSKVIG